MDDRTNDDDGREIYHVIKYKWARGQIPGGHPHRQHALVHDGDEVMVNADSHEEAARIVL